MNKDSWIALIIAFALTVLVTMPLYYSRAEIGRKGKMSEGSDKKVKRPIKSMGNKSFSVSSDG